MLDGDLARKIEQMSEYLDEDAVAAALRIPVDIVRGVIQGCVNISEEATEKETVLQVTTNPVYRQRVISVWRGRGGAGCTSVALHLAYMLEQAMTVLLIDLNVAAAGSDLGYFLRLPEYPNLEVVSRDGELSTAIIQVESGLWVLLPPTTGTIDRKAISRLATEARRDFDAVIFDLPNTDDEFVLEAVAYSNALVMVVTGLAPEMNRALARKNMAQKETVLIANDCTCDKITRSRYAKVVEIPKDKELKARMEKGLFLKQGSPLTEGAGKIRDALFGMPPQENKAFGQVMKRLLVGAVGGGK